MTHAGPTLRTDVLLAIVFRQPEPIGPTSYLQLYRVKTARPMPGSWQPVMGHIEPGETSPDACRRELAEEIGLENPSDLWQLDGVHPFYLASTDTIHLAPAFAVRVPESFAPVLNAEHDASRWVHEDDVAREFVWPFQIAAIREIRDYLLRPTPARDELRL